MIKIERALVSVFDKSGVVDFVRTLEKEFGIEIYSTGGTAKTLRDGGIEVFDIGEYTGYGVLLDGRVKTLHPKVFGGILARRNVLTDMRALNEREIVTFDIVVVNFYPFEKVVAKGADLAEAIENIDIGGPSMVRAAAKNHKFVVVVTSKEQYKTVIDEMRKNRGAVTDETSRMLAVEAFSLTAHYDAQINAYLRGLRKDSTPERLVMSYERVGGLRYGENPHQKATLYRKTTKVKGSIAQADVLSAEKALSFNNYLDAEAALNCVRNLTHPASAIIKHTIPCGLALGEDLSEAFKKAYEGDPTSAYGGIVSFNRKLDSKTAKLIATNEKFFEVVVAPGYDEDALEILSNGAKWSKNLRILKVDSVTPPDELELRYISGGLLLQDADTVKDDFSEWKVVTKKKVSDEQMKDLRFAYHCVRWVKSNAITLVKDLSLVGAGGGQTARVDAAKIAVMKAGKRAEGAVAGSDAFFPFPDGVTVLADAGVTAIVQPGGSMRDEEVIKVADERGIAMVFTGRRHFRH